ncbi:nucleotidyl transferase AbiEii/AbiGii toxin family protein [Plastorhodobacter daqingensis]|uniref:Nucleotidyl transferase AbiEii/AbiGii toxin family protein n=1 Tax=Plastorhodobacter daqingensis TaxID=1387281 RepID=A0ABW2ULC7_9RHOB
MTHETHEAQVALPVRVLPHVAGENKGGTAIDPFSLVRLTVDIDLTYLPIQEQAESLDAINTARDRIAAFTETATPERHQQGAHRRFRNRKAPG